MPMPSYEIEKKFLIEHPPANYESYPHLELEQGYLSTNPVVRIRKEGDNYYLTYKSKGLMIREEYNLPLTKDSYEHLRTKVDGLLIHKIRYKIPIEDNLTVELDIFKDEYEGLLLAEVEFPTKEQADSFQPLSWFKEDVTEVSTYHNSNLSKGRL